MDTIKQLRSENAHLRDRIDQLMLAGQGQGLGDSILHRILHAIPGGIVHVAPTGAILLANRQAQRFLGLSFDELTQRYTVDFEGKTYREDGAPCSVAEYPVTRCLVTGEPQGPTTIGVEQPDGTIHWAVFNAIPVPHGGQTSAMVIFIDITAHHAAEEENRRLQEQLQHTERLAAMGTLAAGMAHEINNPLTFIIGNISLIRASLSLSPEHLQMLEDVQEGALRISQIVRDLQQFTRVDTAASAVVDVAKELDRAASMAAAELRHRARLVKNYKTLPPVAGDASRLMQVFINLLVNAAHSIEAGHLDDNQITITGRADGAFVVIEIEDSGCGMDEATRRRATDPFFTTKQVGSGTGLGLSISHHIVDTIGGTMAIDSTVGQGTRVTLRLPISRQAPEPTPAPPPTPRPLGEPLRVLFVDDEPAILTMLRGVLRDYRQESASSGQEAIERCMERDFDVILCDLMMPDCTGMDVYAHLKRARPGMARRMLFMSGGVYTDAAKHFLAQVDRPCLIKPFSLDRLRELIEETASRGD